MKEISKSDERRVNADVSHAHIVITEETGHKGGEHQHKVFITYGELAGIAGAFLPTWMLRKIIQERERQETMERMMGEMGGWR